MARFVTERLFQMFITVLLVATFVFIAVAVLAGDPVLALFGFRAVPQPVYDASVAQFHLDRALLVQYWLFVSDALEGNVIGTAIYAWSLLLVSIPVLVLAYTSRTYLSVTTDWFPSAGVNSIAVVAQTVADLLHAGIDSRIRIRGATR